MTFRIPFPAKAAHLSVTLNFLALGVVFMGMAGLFLNLPALSSWGSSLTSLVPNTALSLLLLCAGLCAFTLSRPRLAQMLGASAAIFTGIILSQYLTGRDYGIDRLLPTLTNGSVRTSPNAGTAIILFGLTLVFAGAKGPVQRAAAACASGALALALLAFIGYSADLMPAFRWGTLAGMSLPTATAILLLALGFFAAMRAHRMPMEPGMPLLATSVIILAAVSASAVITNSSLIENNRWVRHSLETRDLLRSIGQQVDLCDRIERSHYNTGDPADAQRLTIGEETIWRQYEALHTLVAAEALQLARVETLQLLLKEKLRRVRDLYALGIQGQVHADVRRRGVLTSLESTDAVSAELDALLDNEAQSLRQRSDDASQSAEQTRRITWLAGGLSVILLAAAVAANTQARRSREVARKAMLAAHDAAIESSRLKSEFLANMSHELRTPMNGIIGTSELLLESPLTPEQRDMGEMVLNSSEALLKIINDILDFSKIEAGRMQIDAQPFELRRVIEDCSQLLAPRAHEKNVEFILDYDPQLPARFLGDGGRIRQIVMNLAGNAVKFTSAGEVLVHVSQRDAAMGGATFRVEVIDTGEGIPLAAQERLFEPFTQADAATTRRFGGTGLGLTISRQLIELMGGRIGFRSSEGKGSLFWFELQLPLDATQPGATSSRQDLSGRRFLVIDDNATNRKVVAAQLAAMGAESECAAGAGEALSLLREGHSFTALLLDWHMPDCDGPTLAAELRKSGLAGEGGRGGRWIILLSSAASNSPDNSQSLFDGVLVKPVRMADLERCLLRLVNGGSQKESTPSSAPAMETPSSIPLHLLLVEDNISNQRVARMLLQRLGHEVDVAGDGRTALQKIAASRYDAVLMDCQMPVLDGYETTRCIRRGETPGVERDICVIALTANAMASDRLKCLDAGMNDFVTKPVRLDDLRDVLARCVKPGRIPAT